AEESAEQPAEESAEQPAEAAGDSPAEEPSIEEAAVQQSGGSGEPAPADADATEAESESADQEAQGGSLTEGTKSPSDDEQQNTDAHEAAGE
ncbi:MAG: hypothetical protein ACK4S4_15495, partial [Pyrinomonadaceae bacterium]